MRLSKAVFRYIENELFDYDATKRAIDELSLDIIAERPRGPRSRSATSDPTAAKGIRLASNATLLRMHRTIAAVDTALARLSDDHRRLYDLRYRKRLSWQRVCDEMSLSRTAYFDLRRSIVRLVAVHMGFSSLD